MPKRCVYGTCNSDARYPERLDGGKVKFIPFPKPKTNMQKCMEWIKLCGRPREQLNPDKITSNYYVCTKHFVDPSGPTPMYPDPVSADPHSPAPKPSRPKPAKRLCLEKDKVLSHSTDTITEESVCEMINLAFTDSENTQADSHTTSEVIEQVVTCDSSTQTSDNWIDPLDFFSLSAELSSLRDLVAEQQSTINLLSDAREMQNKNKLLQNVLDKQNKELNAVKKELKAVKDVYPRCDYKKVNKNSKLMQFYTGFSAVTFAAICSFFIPDGDVPFVTTKEKKVFKTLTPQNQLFFCFLKLRHNFEFQDLACRFGISVQAASTMFSSWINYLYLRCGEVSIWPHIAQCVVAYFVNVVSHKYRHQGYRKRCGMLNMVQSPRQWL